MYGWSIGRDVTKAWFHRLIVSGLVLLIIHSPNKVTLSRWSISPPRFQWDMHWTCLDSIPPWISALAIGNHHSELVTSRSFTIINHHQRSFTVDNRHERSFTINNQYGTIIHHQKPVCNHHQPKLSVLNRRTTMSQWDGSAAKVSWTWG